METFILEEDIIVFYVTASSFPEGITGAMQRLHSLAPAGEGRRFFGISRPEDGVIVYKAAAEEITKGELAAHGLGECIIPKGKYLATILTNYPTRIEKTGEIFQVLIHEDGIDPEGYCIEWYLDEKDMRCMVRMAD